MEYEKEFASKGVGTAGLTTGIIGTALGAMANGFASGIFGGNCGNNKPQYVSKEVFDVQLQLIDAQKSNAILAADLNTETKIVDAFKSSVERENKIRDELKTEIAAVDQKLNDNIAAQSVINAQVASQVNLNTSQISQLFSLTQLTIPNRSVNPGWGNVYITPTGGGTICGCGTTNA